MDLEHANDLVEDLMRREDLFSHLKAVHGDHAVVMDVVVQTNQEVDLRDD